MSFETPSTALRAGWDMCSRLSDSGVGTSVCVRARARVHTCVSVCDSPRIFSGASPLGQEGDARSSPKRVGAARWRARLGTRMYHHFPVLSLTCFSSPPSLFSHPCLGLEVYGGVGREDPKKAL